MTVHVPTFQVHMSVSNLSTYSGNSDTRLLKQPMYHQLLVLFEENMKKYT